MIETGQGAGRRQLLGGALAFCLPAATAGAAEADWRFVTEYPADTMPGEGIAAFARDVASRGAGAIAISPGYDAPDGLRSARMLDAVAADQVQAADAFTGALGGIEPLFQLSSLPFLTSSTHDADRLWVAAEGAYRATLAARGLVLLYATPWPPTGLWTRRPFTGTEALAGLRIRTYDAASTAVFSRAGAAPTQLSFADTLPRLRDGTLDAVLSSGDGGAGARLWELLPHFTALDYAFPLSLAFCSAAALDRLPGSTRDLLVEIGTSVTRRQFTAVDLRVAANERRLVAQGVTVSRNRTARDALAAVSGDVITEWQRKVGAPATAILEAYRA